MSEMPSQVRTLYMYAIILTTCTPADPLALWGSHRDSMTENYRSSDARRRLASLLIYIYIILAEKLLRQRPFDGAPTTVIPRQSLDGYTVVS